MYAPVESDYYHEWIELYNPTSSPIDLSNWTLYDGNEQDTIMGDIDHGNAVLVTQSGQQVEDLGPDRDIQHGNGLVGNQEDRIQDERTRDDHPLSLSTRELLGIAPQKARSRFEASILEGGGHHGEFLFVAGGYAVHTKRLGYGAKNRLAGIERFIGVLEDQLHLSTELPPAAPPWARAPGARGLDPAPLVLLPAPWSPSIPQPTPPEHGSGMGS